MYVQAIPNYYATASCVQVKYSPGNNCRETLISCQNFICDYKPVLFADDTVERDQKEQKPCAHYSKYFPSLFIAVEFIMRAARTHLPTIICMDIMR